MIKNFVLDTNILMSTEGKAINGFDDNHIIIPSIVIEELDNLKTAYGEKGFQAREAIRKIGEVIDDVKNKTDNSTWRINEGKGLLQIKNTPDENFMSKDYNPAKPDNMIINTALALIHENEYRTLLVTNDLGMKLKAVDCKIDVQSYYNDQIDPDFTYSGRREIKTRKNIDSIFECCTFEVPKGYALVENEYVKLISEKKVEDGKEVTEAACIYKDGILNLLPDLDHEVCGIGPKNIGQRFALDALLAPAEEIPLVLLKGSAGTGKTLLSLAAALSKLDDYDKIVCARANVLADADIGFLPGDIQDKTLPLLAPIVDNLTFLLSNDGEMKDNIAMQIDDMFDSGMIEVTSLAYIRGRSLPKTFIILDESQNLTRLQAKTIITRAGVGSKVVFMGDLNQIDSPKLDKRNNGLAYLSEKFKGSPLCAQIEFEESESVRSPLALEAINRL